MAPAAASRGERRVRLGDAKLLLIFTPDLAAADPLAALEAAMPYVDIVQVRPKPLGDRAAGSAARATITEARAAFEWCQRVLDLRAQLDLDAPPLVFVNDRVDVAIALAEAGLDGVHVGTDDMPAKAARRALGEDQLLGLSSHTTRDLGRAWDEPIDMLGFGPIFATATKGYGAGDAPASTYAPRVVGPELAWVASETAPVPVFPIGGIHLGNIAELDRVGRAAVGSAILGAEDPGQAARHLREALLGGI
ncbi:Thiamine-phosphate synthase [Planctomycetes bacterium Poly30]|uniref:Thiamine-phosphate synthase n=1 Tax=Saltatorellus ferox TaxID=2528018 RepID=A0A518EX85_9BACT|nr:Thiamine-phosphate synthase [Planctomycetes bacterium Poly30]